MRTPSMTASVLLKVQGADRSGKSPNVPSTNRIADGWMMLRTVYAHPNGNPAIGATWNLTLKHSSANRSEGPGETPARYKRCLISWPIS